jgi:hypothetical protein
MKTAFVVFLLFGFYGSADVFGVDPTRLPQQPVTVMPVPQVILVPRTTMVPYQLDRTEVIRREFRTPVRDWFLGRYRINNYYRSQVQQ